MKKTITHNLLERFRDYHWDILQFFYDFDVPFDSNLSERDIRVTKVKQKISGGFGIFDGVRYLVRRRRFVAVAQKQYVSVVDGPRDVFGDKQIQLRLVGVDG